MGAWGPGPFENDDALDWLGDLAASSGTDVVEDALDLPPASADLPEAPDCMIALAAAETVAAMRGRPRGDLPDEVRGFVLAATEPSPSLVEAAISAVARVLENSELRDLWEETGDYSEWRATLIDLRGRLGAG